MPQSRKLSTGVRTSIKWVPYRFSSRWLPQHGIFPVSEAAPADAVPSQLVRAPRTELA